uniref:Threonylcarbamoyl-AMP synthase n=1 Tax=Nothobranchius furzeri TaxID=105023 RepID=A0A8C6KCX3_NOTFU
MLRHFCERKPGRTLSLRPTKTCFCSVGNSFSVCKLCFMNPARFFVVKSTSFRRANGSAVVCRLGAKMCKELKTKLFHLLPSTSNGSTTHQELQTDGAEILSCTVKALKDGHVVAVPTDTIYGLACLAQNSEAVQKIYNLKERNGVKPLAICVGEIQEIYKYCKVKVKGELLDDLLPGPVTLVFERSEALNTNLNPFTSVSLSLSNNILMKASEWIILSKDPSARRCSHSRSRLHEAPLPDVWGTASTHQRQHQLTNQHGGSPSKCPNQATRLSTVEWISAEYQTSCFPAEGVPGALAEVGCGGGWWTHRGPEPPRINGDRFVGPWKIPHHQTRLCSCFYARLVGA